MSHKQFYEKTGVERKREYRQRAAAAKLDSKLNEIQMNSFSDDAAKELSNEVPMVIEHFDTHNENDDYQFNHNENLDIQHGILQSLSAGEGVGNNDNYDGNDDDVDDDVDDDNDSDNDISEFINLFDTNRERKLYESSAMSVYESCMEIIKLSRNLNLNKLQMQRLLNGLHRLLSMGNKLPLRVRGLLKIVDIDRSTKVNYYCRECLQPLLSIQQSVCTYGCTMNNKRRSFKNISELVVCDVKKELSTTAKRYIDLIREYQSEQRTSLPGDILNSQIYKNLPSNEFYKLTLLLHTDGAPVTKVGGKSLWPVQCTLVEIPPPLRDHADATMILGAWLGGTHPNRDLLWSKIVEQIYDLFRTGIMIITNTGEKIKFAIRAQLVTFDLPALAQNCNIIQFNGYNACPDCDIHGVAIEKQIFYPYSRRSSAPKTDQDYLTLSIQQSTLAASKGIKGPTPLTRILFFPDQIAKDYMHLVCSGHFKTLITYWERILLPGVFDQSSNYLTSIVLPHSFKYQFIPLTQYSQWKTKMFRDFLLYISPVFAALFLPDSLALHFLHYFIYIRALYFYEDIAELNEIESIFDYYYENISKYYGEKSQLCTLHLHLHLKDQVLKHGSLVFTSCFARESYIGYSLKWCLGKKYILKQFITWYNVDRSLALANTMKLKDLFNIDKFDGTFINMSYIQNYEQKLIMCLYKKNLVLTKPKFYSRYSRGIKMFHSRAYTRTGNGISYFISVLTQTCPMHRKTCLGEVLFYFNVSGHYYALIKKYKCINFSICNALSTVSVPQVINDRLNSYYSFYHHNRYSYKVIPVSCLSNKVINMKWDNDMFVYTDVVCEWEHD